MPEENRTPPSQRLMSLDALRGFDMFWIMGGDSLAASLNRLGYDPATKHHNPITGFFGEQLEHVEWAGFHFYDLIFPLFVFIVGVSLVFSLSRQIEQHGRAGALQRLFVRSLLLFVVALLYSGGFSNHWPNIRLLGVLNRIALCYGFAGFLFCFLRGRALAAVCGALLIGYWALMTFVPFPDVRPVNGAGELLDSHLAITNVTDTAMLNWNTTNTVSGVFAPGLNLANYLDAKYLPGKKWDHLWDPEGILSTIPAIGTCLLGVLAGLLLRQSSSTEGQKVLCLVGAGVVGVVAGFVWGLQFPVVKKIWSSSFVLVAGGYSAILLGLFYYLIDVRQHRKWCQVFVWYGMNSITVYLADNLLRFRKVSERFLGGDVQNFLDARVAAGFGDLMVSFGEIGIGLCLVWFLYRRKIFLRL